MSRLTAFSRCADWLWKTRDVADGRTLQIADTARFKTDKNGRARGGGGGGAIRGGGGGGGKLGFAPDVRRVLSRSKEEEMEEETKMNAIVDRRHANILIMSGGKAHVPDTRLSEFRRIYAWDITNKIVLSMCEVEPSLDTVRRMKYDADHKRLDRFVTPKEIAEMVLNLHKVQHMFFPQGGLRGVLLQREHCVIVKDGKRVYTSGQHILWSRGTVSGHKCRRIWASATYVLQKQCGHLLQNYMPGHDTFETLLDPAVYKGGLRMPYSVKYQPCGACNDVNRAGCFRCKGAGKFNLGREYKPTHEIMENGELRAFTLAELADIGALVERCSVRVANAIERSDYTVDECQPHFPETLDDPKNINRRQQELHAFQLAEEEAAFQEQQEQIESEQHEMLQKHGLTSQPLERKTSLLHGTKRKPTDILLVDHTGGSSGGGGGGDDNQGLGPSHKKQKFVGGISVRGALSITKPVTDSSSGRRQETKSGGGGVVSRKGHAVGKETGLGGGGGGEGEGGGDDVYDVKKQMLERQKRHRAALSEQGAPKLPLSWVYHEPSVPQYTGIARFIRTALAPEYRDARCSSLASTPTGTKYVMHTKSKYCQNLRDEHNGRTVYFVFDSQNRTCRQRCCCKCKTKEGRVRGECKDYHSDETPLSLELARLLFGTRGERSANSKQKKKEASQRFNSQLSGRVLTGGDLILQHIRKSNGGKVPQKKVLSRSLVEREDDSD
jgi:hypothetical protein